MSCTVPKESGSLPSHLPSAGNHTPAFGSHRFASFRHFIGVVSLRPSCPSAFVIFITDRGFIPLHSGSTAFFIHFWRMDVGGLLLALCNALLSTCTQHSPQYPSSGCWVIKAWPEAHTIAFFYLLKNHQAIFFSGYLSVHSTLRCKITIVSFLCLLLLFYSGED